MEDFRTVTGSMFTSYSRQGDIRIATGNSLTQVNTADWRRGFRSARLIMQALLHPFMVRMMLILVIGALVLAFPSWKASVMDQPNSVGVPDLARAQDAFDVDGVACSIREALLSPRTLLLVLWVLLCNLVATFIWFYLHKSKTCERKPRPARGRVSAMAGKNRRKRNVFQQLIAARDQRLDAITELLPVVPLGGHTCRIWQTVDDDHDNGSKPICRLTLEPEYSSHDALLKTGFIITWVQSPEFFPMEYYLYFEYAGYEPLLQESLTVRVTIGDQVREYPVSEYHVGDSEDGRGTVETLLVRADQDMLLDMLACSSFSIQIEDEIMEASPKLRSAINDLAVRFRKAIS